MNIRKILLASLASIALVGSAHDFESVIGGQHLYFNINPKDKSTVTVTYHGKISDTNRPTPAGTVALPSTVTHEKKQYTITAIGPKAFAGAKNLKGIVIPKDVKTIGDFAFEGCDSLASVVFPGSPVKFGQGTFFKCKMIENVSLGSDWESVDLTMFRWSDALSSITIPAKIATIRGVEYVKGLKAIVVDSNNSHYAAVDGILYTKNGEELLACPRRYEGKVKVAEGTKKIKLGSLFNCIFISAIDLPASLESISYRETARMTGLKQIIVRCDKPLVTAYVFGKGKFLFQLPNEDINVVLPTALKKQYEELLTTFGGTYSETPEGIRYQVDEKELVKKENIKWVKNFEKYSK